MTDPNAPITVTLTRRQCWNLRNAAAREAKRRRRMAPWIMKDGNDLNALIAGSLEDATEALQAADPAGLRDATRTAPDGA